MPLPSFGWSAPCIEDRVIPSVLAGLRACGNTACHASDRRRETHLVPRSELSGLGIAHRGLGSGRLLASGLRCRGLATGHLCHDLSAKALAVGRRILSDFAKHARFSVPAHDLFARRAGCHHALVSAWIRRVGIADLSHESLEGFLEFVLTVPSDGAVDVVLQADARQLARELLLYASEHLFGVLEKQRGEIWLLGLLARLLLRPTTALRILATTPLLLQIAEQGALTRREIVLARHGRMSWRLRLLTRLLAVLRGRCWRLLGLGLRFGGRCLRALRSDQGSDRFRYHRAVSGFRVLGIVPMRVSLGRDGSRRGSAASCRSTRLPEIVVAVVEDEILWIRVLSTVTHEQSSSELSRRSARPSRAHLSQVTPHPLGRERKTPGLACAESRKPGGQGV